MRHNASLLHTRCKSLRVGLRAPADRLSSSSSFTSPERDNANLFLIQDTGNQDRKKSLARIPTQQTTQRRPHIAAVQPRWTLSDPDESEEEAELQMRMLEQMSAHVWTCPTCTYDKNTKPKCEICGTDTDPPIYYKKRKQPETPVRQSTAKAKKHRKQYNTRTTPLRSSPPTPTPTPPTPLSLSNKSPHQSLTPQRKKRRIAKNTTLAQNHHNPAHTGIHYKTPINPKSPTAPPRQG